MTNQEFSDQFDVFYNNITSNQAPGLDEYEKSVFLTRALDEIIKDYFTPGTNKLGAGFDDTERRLIDFSMLIKVILYKKTVAALDTKESIKSKPFSITPSGVISGGDSVNTADSLFDFRSNSVSLELPKDIMMFLNEQLEVIRYSSNTSTLSDKHVFLQIIPLNYSEYTRLMSKPFKRPLHYQAWRLSNFSLSSGMYNNVANIIVGPSDQIINYTIRYVKRPRAIILGPLEGVTLDGESANQECELDSILHHEILQRAVELAKLAWLNTGEQGSAGAALAQAYGIGLSGTPIGPSAGRQ